MLPAIKPGTLYIVATPIGNLEDVTYRAIRVLRDVDLVAAEDTRRAAKLLTHYGITTRRTSFHAHNEARKTAGLLDRLARGQTVAVVSDAGTPLVSDPGRRLARAALDGGFPVEAVPGASAVLAALVSSGFAADAFTFVGFPPNRSKDRKQWFADRVGVSHPLIFFEAPHRLRVSLADLHAVAGDRTITVCRELTKIHEQLVIGPIMEVLRRLPEPRGEFTCVVEPSDDTPARPKMPGGPELLKEFCHMTENSAERRGAIRALATKYQVPSREVYRALEVAKAQCSG